MFNRSLLFSEYYLELSLFLQKRYTTLQVKTVPNIIHHMVDKTKNFSIAYYVLIRQLY